MTTIKSTIEALIVQALEDQIDDKPQSDEDRLPLQLDSALPHYGLQSRQLLDQYYPAK